MTLLHNYSKALILFLFFQFLRSPALYLARRVSWCEQNLIVYISGLRDEKKDQKKQISDSEKIVKGLENKV